MYVEQHSVKAYLAHAETNAILKVAEGIESSSTPIVRDKISNTYIDNEVIDDD